MTTRCVAGPLRFRSREDRRVCLRSLEKETPADFELDNIQLGSGDWSEYVKGMAFMLQDAGLVLRGWEGVLTSDVPVGSGLSSSAALEMAVARSFSAVSRFPFNGVEMARLGQKCENEWVGANTGIMDQMISANGLANHALLIDCRDLAVEAIPLPEGTAIGVMDTMTRHKHAESGYNERRASCERAADILGKTHLRDVTIEDLHSHKTGMDDDTFRRARHVITENQRVLDAVHAMKDGDAATLGLLMNASHTSLRDDFEVTNDALDIIVKIALEQDGCYGARMTGGGFGGCAVALVNTGKVEGMSTMVADKYEGATNLKPNVFFTNATDGTAAVPLRKQGER